MSKYFLIILFLVAATYAQVETEKWGTTKVDYRLQTPPDKTAEINTGSISDLFISSAQVTYYKLFSEYDGDNCPFHPSCSAFFVESVETTNLLHGALMFADRFTRDTNFFKGFDDYPLHSTGKFYDPASKYAFIPLEEQRDYHSDE